MTIEQLEQELKQGNLASLYLLYGKEEFLLDASVKRIKKLFGEMLLGINYIQIDNTNVDSLMKEIQTPSFGYEKKLIIVKKSNLFSKTKKTSNSKKDTNNLADKVSSYIEENIKIINKSVILVFIEAEVETSSLLKTIEKHGKICNFEKLKPFQIAKRLKGICEAYKVKIDDNTLKVLIETCGTSMQILINEIRKLIEYVGENGVITKKEIELLSVKEFDSVIFDLTDSLGKKNIVQALNILHELIYNKEPVQKILITLYGHFRKIYLTKLAIKFNKNIVETLKLRPNQLFLANKYKMQIQYFDEKQLRKILKELTDLDYNYKKGNIDINIGLEAILCAYCG